MTWELLAALRKRRVLLPHERIAEVLFGLIMVLTVTGSVSVATVNRDEIDAMLIGALGCNVAWGIIDGVLYLMGSFAEKSQNRRTLRTMRRTADPQKAHRMIADALPPLVASLLQPSELETLRQRLLQLPEPPRRVHLNRRDFVGALGVLLFVFLSTFPVALPFIVMRSPVGALRVSNTIAIVMLFVAGVAYGRSAGRSAWAFGVGMVVLGVALVTLTKALGG